MTEDSIVRQLEVFINKGGRIETLKRLLSTCATDEDLWKELLVRNK